MAKTFILSDQSLNTYGFRIITLGIMLDQFKKNPLMYFMHRRPGKYDDSVIEKLPIGIWENIRIEGDKLLAEPSFDLDDAFAAKIATKVEKGYLRMASLGAESIETSADPLYLIQGQTRETVTKCLALEASIVDMGGNLNAFALTSDSGFALYTGGNLMNLSNNTENTIPEIKLTNIKNDMSKIALSLGLAVDATEDQIITAITELNSKVAANAIELAALNKQKIDSIIKLAVDKKKITAAEKEDYISLLNKDFELGSKIIEALKPQATASSVLDLTKDNNASVTKKLKEFSLSEIEDMRANNKPEYIKLYKAEYGKEPIVE